MEKMTRPILIPTQYYGFMDLFLSGKESIQSPLQCGKKVAVEKICRFSHFELRCPSFGDITNVWPVFMRQRRIDQDLFSLRIGHFIMLLACVILSLSGIYEQMYHSIARSLCKYSINDMLVNFRKSPEVSYFRYLLYSQYIGIVWRLLHLFDFKVIMVTELSELKLNYVLPWNNYMYLVPYFTAPGFFPGNDVFVLIAKWGNPIWLMNRPNSAPQIDNICKLCIFRKCCSQAITFV